MSNPYLLDRPAVVSFSGGRTSGYMLWHILRAFGGTLPDDVRVVFCNTGKERPETLDFVERCSQRWNVPVTWLEYRFIADPMQIVGKLIRTTKNGDPVRAPCGRHAFAVVDYPTASRSGEPFEQVIAAKHGKLPNFGSRFCTSELKERNKYRYLRSLGWESWANAIGFRADEPNRVAKARRNAPWFDEVRFPLHQDGQCLSDVFDFWRKQDFDLAIDSHEGNCDLCFLKSPSKIRRILSERPDLAAWWIAREAHAAANPDLRDAARFRNDRPPYRVQLELAQRPGLFDDLDAADELSAACHCTD